MNWLNRFQIRTFIDVGAFKGEYIDFARKHFPDAAIYAFEPLPQMYKALQEKRKEDKNIIIYPYALGDANGAKFMYQSSYPPSSSLLPMGKLHKQNFPESSKQKRIRVNIKTLDFVLSSHKLKKDIFVKIDTQGYEDRIIAGGEKVFRQATLLLIEVSFQELYKKQSLFHDIYTQLYSLGFCLYGFRNQIVSPLDGSILQAHAYFIHKGKCHI